MALTSNSNFQMKLLIEKNSQKVLFAEVGKDVVDFLFGLLSLPIGSVTNLPTKDQSAFGTLRNTYSSWERLDHSFLSSDKMIAWNLIPCVSPISSYYFTRLLARANPGTVREKVYICCCVDNFNDVCRTFCQNCRKMKKYSELSYAGTGLTKEAVESNGYVKEFTYALTDDLSVFPMTPLASIALLNKLGHKDLSLLEEKKVSLNVEKGWELLKTSFVSENVLTDVFLTKKRADIGSEKVLKNDTDVPLSKNKDGNEAESKLDNKTDVAVCQMKKDDNEAESKLDNDTADENEPDTDENDTTDHEKKQDDDEAKPEFDEDIDFVLCME